ncbi:MAG: hypothetical protein AAGM04_08260 [Pseudomonadota bacterium]
MTGIFKSLLLLSFLVAAYEGAHAQTARTFGEKKIVVRLCPEKCTLVTGHGFKAGGKTTVFETRDGWARVTAFLDRARLVPTFGNDIPQKPALWVPANTLASQAASTPAARPAATARETQAKSQPTARRATNDKKVTLPSFRPGTVFASAPAEPTEPVVAATDAPKEPAEAPAVPVEPTETAVVDPVQSSLPPGAVRRDDGTVVLRDVVRVEDGKPKGNEARKALTWAEVQERIRQKAAQAGQQVRTQRVVREAKPAVPVISAEEKRAQDAAIEQARKAREAAEAERQRQAAAAAAKAAEVAAAKPAPSNAQSSTGVTYAPPKVEEEKQPDTQVAAVQPDPEPTQTFEAAKPDPISIGARPKSFTKALADKRLAKLPGPKSRVRKDVVIALRHMGLSLLKNGICKGIAGGGPSTTPGMLYVTCTDDPSYLHQFPLEEASW